MVYGYRRSDDDKNKLVIDQTVAPVIQSIFSMKMDGFSPAQIADKLNKDGIPSPYEYKRQSGSKYQSGFKKQIQTDWGAKAIYRILKMRCTPALWFRERRQLQTIKSKAEPQKMKRIDENGERT